MKTIKLFLATLVLSMFTITSYSQSDTKVGGFLAYGTEIENLGIGVNAEFPILDKLTISLLLFIIFLKKNQVLR